MTTPPPFLKLRTVLGKTIDCRTIKDEDRREEFLYLDNVLIGAIYSERGDPIVTAVTLNRRSTMGLSKVRRKKKELYEMQREWIVRQGLKEKPEL